MKRNLLIIGAGQYGVVAEETARAMNVFEKIDFLDDNSEKAIGRVNDFASFADVYQSAFVAVGNAEFRLAQSALLEACGFELAKLIHPTAYVSPTAVVSSGSIVEPCAVINPGVIIERCCIISAGAIINHNSKISKACHIDCGVVVCSNATVTPKQKLPCGSVFSAQSVE